MPTHAGGVAFGRIRREGREFQIPGSRFHAAAFSHGLARRRCGGRSASCLVQSSLSQDPLRPRSTLTTRRFLRAHVVLCFAEPSCVVLAFSAARRRASFSSPASPC